MPPQRYRVRETLMYDITVAPITDTAVSRFFNQAGHDSPYEGNAAHAQYGARLRNRLSRAARQRYQSSSKDTSASMQLPNKQATVTAAGTQTTEELAASPANGLIDSVGHEVVGKATNATQVAILVQQRDIVDLTGNPDDSEPDGPNGDDGDGNNESNDDEDDEGNDGGEDENDEREETPAFNPDDYEAFPNEFSGDDPEGLVYGENHKCLVPAKRERSKVKFAVVVPVRQPAKARSKGNVFTAPIPHPSIVKKQNAPRTVSSQLVSSHPSPGILEKEKEKEKEADRKRRARNTRRNESRRRKRREVRLAAAVLPIEQTKKKSHKQQSVPAHFSSEIGLTKPEPIAAGKEMKSHPAASTPRPSSMTSMKALEPLPAQTVSPPATLPPIRRPKTLLALKSTVKLPSSNERKKRLIDDPEVRRMFDAIDSALALLREEEVEAALAELREEQANIYNGDVPDSIRRTWRPPPCQTSEQLLNSKRDELGLRQKQEALMTRRAHAKERQEMESIALTSSQPNQDLLKVVIATPTSRNRSRSEVAPKCSAPPPPSKRAETFPLAVPKKKTKLLSEPARYLEVLPLPGRFEKDLSAVPAKKARPKSPTDGVFTTRKTRAARSSPTKSPHFEVSPRKTEKAQLSPTKSPHFATLPETKGCIAINKDISTVKPMTACPRKALKEVSSSKRPPKGTPILIPPAFDEDKPFGLIQEELADCPYHVMLACIFLNKTQGRHAIPLLRKLLAAAPTPESLLENWTLDWLVELMYPLGLQFPRSKSIFKMAEKWEEGRKLWVRRSGYPTKSNEENWGCIMGDMPGIGPYAIDSWRIFCMKPNEGGVIEPKEKRTKTAPVPAYGGNFAEGDEEWRRVDPTDKELKLYLRWKRAKETWELGGRVGPNRLTDYPRLFAHAIVPEDDDDD